MRFTPSSQPFTEQHLDLEALADYAVLALSNARPSSRPLSELEERKRAEAALRRTEEQLRHAQKMEAVGRLTGGICSA